MPSLNYIRYKIIYELNLRASKGLVCLIMLVLNCDATKPLTYPLQVQIPAFIYHCGISVQWNPSMRIFRSGR